MSYWGYGFMGGAGFYPYEIPYSCRFNDNDSAYMSYNIGNPTNGKLYTFSTWIKSCGTSSRYVLGQYSDGNNHARISFGALIQVSQYETGWEYVIETDGYYRDVTGWYHLLVKYDSTQGTAADRCIIYVNGTAVSLQGANDVELNETSRLNANGLTLYIGQSGNNNSYFDGYLAETHFIDGQALTPSNFGVTKNGIWVPKKYAGTYGNNGFYLDYADSANLGTDQSGNDNDFTETNFTAADQVVDTPTNNYPTLLPFRGYIQTSATMSDGNLTATGTAGAARFGWSSVGLPLSIGGKWYWEVEIDANDEATQNCWMGVFTDYGDSFQHAATGEAYDNSGWAAFGDAWDNGDIIGLAFDAGAKELKVYNNNVLQGTITEGATLEGFWYPASRPQHSAAAQVHKWDFGQLGFTYTPPSGYRALCSKNLPDPAMPVGNADKFFDIDTYTGDGAASHARTGFSFSPDLVWIKCRTQGAGYHHTLGDSVRGANLQLFTSSISDENTETDMIKSFDSGGYTVGADNIVNAAAETFVTWLWKESAPAGFDIVSYSGDGAGSQAINHSLGDVPELVIVKERGDDAGHWFVYQPYGSSDPETDYLTLNGTGSLADLNTIWNDTAPTSTQFTVGSEGDVNGAGDTYIAYLWRSITGFSKVFTYEGNGANDGPFIYCGFRPRFILIKDADGVQNWVIMDSDRTTYNPITHRVYPDSNSAETTTTGLVDFCANGFKIRHTSNLVNDINHTYIGIVFADQPYKYSNAF
jgi:hypothetical protein